MTPFDMLSNPSTYSSKSFLLNHLTKSFFFKIAIIKINILKLKTDNNSLHNYFNSKINHYIKNGEDKKFIEYCLEIKKTNK